MSSEKATRVFMAKDARGAAGATGFIALTHALAPAGSNERNRGMSVRLHVGVREHLCMAEESSITGWVATQEEIADRRAIANRLVGMRIVEVHYINLDYRGWDLGHHDPSVRRAITDEAEWQVPTWDGGQFHHVDLGIELSADGGATWSITWDPLGGRESLRLQEGPARQVGAVWDATAREPWRSCLDSPVTDVQLRYHPWDVDAGSFWCSRISLVFGTGVVETLLGDRGPGNNNLVPSADNIAVLLDPSRLPEWERTDDLV
jgi:hypothetical protein